MGATAELPIPQGGATAELPAPQVGPALDDNETYRALAPEAAKGLRSSMISVGTGLNALAAHFGDTLGLTEFAHSRMADAEHFAAQADAVGPRVRDYRAVKDLTDVTDWVSGMAGEAVGGLAPMAAGGAVGGALRGLRGAAVGAAGSMLPVASGGQAFRTKDSTAPAGEKLAADLGVGAAQTGLMLAVPGAAKPLTAVPAMAAATGIGERVAQAGHTLVDPGRDKSQDNAAVANAAAGGAVAGVPIAAGMAAAGAARRAQTGAEIKAGLGKRDRPLSSAEVPPDEVPDEKVPEWLDKHDERTAANHKEWQDHLKAKEPEGGWDKFDLADPEQAQAFEDKLTAHHEETVDRPELAKKAQGFSDFVKKLTEKPQKDGEKSSQMRTKLDDDLLDTLDEHLTPDQQRLMAPRQKIQLAQDLKDYVMHTWGRRDPSGPESTMPKRLPHQLMDIMGDQLPGLINAYHKQIGKSGVPMSKASGVSKQVKYATEQRAKRLTPLEDIVRTNLREDILGAVKGDRETAIKLATEKLSNRLSNPPETEEGWRQLNSELEYAFGKQKAEHVVAEFEKRKGDVTQDWERMEEPKAEEGYTPDRGELPQTEAELLGRNMDKGSVYHDERLGVPMDVSEGLEAAADMRKQYGPQIRIHHEMEADGRLTLHAEDPAAKVSLTEDELQAAREKHGKAGPENNVVSIVTKDPEREGRNRTLPISIPTLTSETMKNFVFKGKREGAGYVRAAVMEALSRLASTEGFVRFADKSANGFDFPDKMIVGYTGKGESRKVWTWGEIRGAEQEGVREENRAYKKGIVDELNGKLEDAKKDGSLAGNEYLQGFEHLRDAARTGDEKAKEAYTKLVQDYIRFKEEAKSGYYADESTTPKERWVKVSDETGEDLEYGSEEKGRWVRRMDTDKEIVGRQKRREKTGMADIQKDTVDKAAKQEPLFDANRPIGKGERGYDEQSRQKVGTEPVKKDRGENVGGQIPAKKLPSSEALTDERMLKQASEENNQRRKDTKDEAFYKDDLQRRYEESLAKDKAAGKDVMSLETEGLWRELQELGVKPKLSEVKVGREPMDEKTKGEIRSYFERVLGKDKVKVLFDELDRAGTFAKLGAEELYTISNRAIDPRSVGFHEAMHGLMSRISETNPNAANILKDAASSPKVMAQLRKLLADEPAALKQLSDHEERAAYMYQFWAAGKLEVGPRTQGLFQKVMQMLRSAAHAIIGVGEDQNSLRQADSIMAEFHKGGLAERDAAGRALDRIAPQDKMHETWIGRIAERANKTFESADGYVRGMKIPAFAGIADKMFQHEGEVGFRDAHRTQYYRFLNKFNDAIKGLDEEGQKRLLEVLRGEALERDGGNLPTQGGVSDSGRVQAIRKLLDEAHAYMTEAGVKALEWDKEKNRTVEKELGKVPNYFPRVYDRDAIAADMPGFLAMLKRNGVTDTVSVIDKLLHNSKASPDHSDLTGGIAFYAPESLARKLNIPDSELAPYLRKDLAGTMADYFNHVTRRSEYTRRFGNQGEAIDAAIDEGTRQGATEAQVRGFKDYVAAHDGSLGSDLDPQLRKLMTGVMAYQHYRLLPLALLSNLVDPLGIALRGGGVGHAFKAFARGVRDLVSTNDDEGRQFAKTVGAITDAAEAHTTSEQYNITGTAGFLKKANDLLFKYNGMESWNNSGRVQAAVAARDFIIRHAERPNEHSERYLREIGLEKGDVRVKDGQLDLTPAVVDAVNKWVDQAMLRPGPSIRPIYMSDPHFMLISDLNHFAYAFQTVIMRRVAHEAMHGNYKPAMALASYVPAIIASDVMRAAITPGQGDDQRFSKFGLMDWIEHGINRAGLTGAGQNILYGAQDAHFGMPLRAAATQLGPTAQQGASLIEALASGKQGAVGHEAMRALPFYSVLWPGKADPTVKDVD